MMNKLQDLMTDQVPVQVIVDIDDTLHNVIKGIIKNVGRNYIEVLRPTNQDEKSRYATDEVKIIVPIEKIAEVMYYQKT
ncbi:MAG: hypothetical protein AM326_10520 [Candidatus Thorarchaeota archaeon SMTZ-45]|nr:MAG: hypothetical protein AM325_03060 [Candidatus Thorarchaeota archaeon SMTZ1-45]KXH73638.1 MAG: hypothetical protein AM326_10520 [Candidatus Thorarchaeota archaeon SMTZ-45]